MRKHARIQINKSLGRSSFCFFILVTILVSTFLRVSRQGIVFNNQYRHRMPDLSYPFCLIERAAVVNY